MHMKKVVSAVVIVLSVTLTSCWYNHKWEEMHPYGQSNSLSTCDTAGTISYSVTVQPIIQSKCATAGCHVLHAQTNYNVFANVVADAQRTDGADIATRISLAPGTTGYMPDGGSMSSCDILKIKKWIQQGCQNN